MKLFLLAAALISATPALGAPKTIFACKLGLKSAKVTLEQGRFIYRYGAAKKAELTLAGSGAVGDVTAYQGRYASILRQIRFTNGGVSYILYSMGASSTADTRDVSGLSVVRGGKLVSDQSCKPFAEFTAGFEALDALPQDEDSWSAMSLG